MSSQIDIDRLYGATVRATDGGKIGKVGQVYLNNADGRPEWITVKTGLFGGKETFVPLAAATGFDGDDLVVTVSKDAVTGAPRIDEDGNLSPAEEAELFRYYRGNGSGDDDAMTRSEERLDVGTEQVETGRARLRKHVVTESQSVQVPVTREELRVEREPITDANRGAAHDGPDITEDEHEVTLRAERPVVQTEAVPVERVRVGTEQVRDTETVTGEVRKEQIEVDDPSTSRKR